jgi:molybdate transport system substrate-binding protein
MKKCVTLFCFLMFMLAISPVKAQELLVSAAASLTDAFNELQTEFAKNNPGVSIVTNYASSGALYRQIEQGAPVDVYASANMRWMDELIARRHRVCSAPLYAFSFKMCSFRTKKPSLGWF